MSIPSHLDWLFLRFREALDRDFMIWDDRPFSYRWLLERICAWSSLMENRDIRQGSIVALEGSYCPESVAAFLALVDRGAILVPLTEAMAVHRAEFLDIAQVQHLYSFRGGQAGPPAPMNRDVTHPLLLGLAGQGDPGLILFSSGSTGRSKAALHNFIHLLEKFKTPRPSLVTLAFLLFDHIGGINTLLHILSNTGTLVTAASQKPDDVCSAIERHGVELLPASPTFLNLLLISEAYRRHDLGSLRKVTYGTEVMTEQTLDRLRDIVPHAVFQQTYGLTEIGILRTRSRSSDSLWLEVGGEGYETQVRDGILWIRARSAMAGYLNAPSPFDEEGWLNTGDAVEVDGSCIRILGRKSEIINVGGQKVFPAEVESFLQRMENVRDVAVRGEANPITGQAVIAAFNLVEPEELGSLRRRTREFCRTRLAAYKIPARIEIVTADQHNWRFKKMRHLLKSAERPSS
jgi:long-chain acyl-CoA synthetase